MGCGASSAKACSPDATSSRTNSKSAHETRQTQPCDPELLQLLAAHGLVEQLPDLHALGVSKPAHLSDLLVQDLEEVGLSRVQIRQLQRAVSQDPVERSSPSHSPLRLQSNGTAALSRQELRSTPKELAQPRSGTEPEQRAFLLQDDGMQATPMEAMASEQQRVCLGEDAHKDERLHPAHVDRMHQKGASSSEGSRCDEHFEGASDSLRGGRIEVKSKGGKPPLYKQSQKAQFAADAGGGSCAQGPPLNESDSSDVPVPGHQSLFSSHQEWHELPEGEAAKVFQAFSAELLGHRHEASQAADHEDSRASSVDFDVTLLPEVTLPKQPEIQQSSQEAAKQHAKREDAMPLLLNRQDSFDAGPQPSVGREALAPSEQLPAAVRQRLQAREEARKAQQKCRDPSSDREVSERVRSPTRREPRSASERPSCTRVHSGPRAASLGAPSRQMFSKNELRAAHRAMFIGAIEKYKAKLEDEHINLSLDLVRSPSRSKVVEIYLRKRPLFPHEEAKRNDFDVVSVLPGSPPTQLILHSCLFQADLRTPVIHHLRFAFDHVFGEEVSDQTVYDTAAVSLVESAKAGRANTILMFGQTGSGKTHTIKAIERFAAQDLYRSGHRVSLSLVELRGSRCFDLLLPSLPELRLRELREQQSAFVAEGALELRPETPEAVLAAFDAARKRRATSATEANDESSRSHAICSIKFFESGGKPAGSLTLVDCAGTERRKDSANHSRERQQEGAEINASLHALKECIRFMSKRQRIPPHAFRASALTKLLAMSLCSETRLSIICTIAPAASDTEHTLSTLRTGVALRLKGPDHRADGDVQKEVLQNIPAKQRDLHPRQWSPQQVQTWVKELEGGLFTDVCSALPAGFTGQMLVRLSEGHCVQLCGSEDRGRLLFDLLHKAMRGSDSSAIGAK